MATKLTIDRASKNSSAIRGNEATIGRVRKVARPSVTKKPRSIAHAKQLDRPWQRIHDQQCTCSGTAGNDRARSIVGLLLHILEVWLRILEDYVGIRGLRSKILRSEVSVRDPGIIA